MLWCNGWPLSESRGIILHLGALNESLLRPGDLYLCIRAEPRVQLCAVWCYSSVEDTTTETTKTNIIYRPLNPDKDILSPLALDMLAEELPQLLQNLLVSVEHAICRVPIDEVTSFTRCSTTDKLNHQASSASASQQQATTKPVLSPRCSIKRRDVITKSNYRRLGTSTPPKNDNNNQALDPTSMPLFCLGGSFPHIDSDEESAEDNQQNHNETGEFFLLYF